MEFNIKLDNFEGDIDTLIKLAKKQEIDITKISLAEVVSELISKASTYSLEDAGDLLIACANIVELKSRHLLPSPPVEDEEVQNTDTDTIKDLMDGLEEYRKFKDITPLLKKLEETMKNIFPRDGNDIKIFKQQDILIDENITLYDLVSSFKSVLQRARQEKVEIQREIITTEEAKENILKACANEKDGIEFSKIFPPDATRLEIVVTFLALLELVKEKLIKIKQEKQFAEIRIYKYQNG